MTNVLASSADIAVKLTPHMQMTLKKAIRFTAEDEMVEVAPENIRLRKRILPNDERHRKGHEKVQLLVNRMSSKPELLHISPNYHLSHRDCLSNQFRYAWNTTESDDCKARH